MSNEPEERWTPVWDGPGYEVSWDGNFRSLDRTSPSGRSIPGQPIATTTTKDDYELVKYWTAEGKRVTRQAHRVVLENFQFKGAPIPPGLQSRHYDDNGRNNKWRPGSEAESRKAGGNLFTGTGRDQHRDKVRNNGDKPLPVSLAAHDCINHAQCGGKTRNPGKRCVPCVEQVGRDAAVMLRDGRNLLRVAEHFGYKGTDWVFSLSVKHGAYRGSKDEALRQGRRWSQRVTAKVRQRLRRGDAASGPRPAPAPVQGGKAGTAPFGRASHQDNLGHIGQAKSQDVTQRETPQRAEPSRVVTRSSRPHVPYPSDTVRYRAPRKPGVTRHR
jgi:hypothetical protein